MPPPRPVSELGTITVRYFPTHVTYAPPGRSSAIEYSTGTTVGTTVTLVDDRSNSLKVTAGVGFKIPLVASGDLDVAVGNIWGKATTDTLDIAVSRTVGYKKPGDTDGIDHDEDEIWFLVAPKLAVIATPDSSWGPASVTWTLDPNQQLLPYFLYVGELRGTRPMPADVQANLTRWGFQPHDLQDLLSANPFANGSVPGEPLDPDRFQFIGTFPYRPPYSPTSQPELQTLELARKEVNSSATESKNTFTVDVTVDGSVGFAKIFYASVKIDDGLKIITSTNIKDALTGETKTKITIGQPAYGYTGPTVLRVYEDKMFKTWVFALDWV